MKNIKVTIENCYGISKLEHEFDFTETNSYVIYAPNGVMKSSFANVFDDYSKDKDSSDLVFRDRISLRKIIDASGDDVNRDSIFVIRPYEKKFKSNRVSTLLVKEELKKRYSEIHEKIDSAKDLLMKELKKKTKLNKVEDEITSAFNAGKSKIIEILYQLEDSVSADSLIYPFSSISYKVVFDEKVVEFLSTGDFKYQIKQYIEKYNDLIKNSNFLRKEFNHYHATTVQKNLLDNGFFKAEHTINMNMKGVKTEITSASELSKLIDEEKNKILSDIQLQKIFETIDKKISNAQLREFRDYLFENQNLLIELENIQNLKKKVWLSYLQQHSILYLNLIKEYKDGQVELKKIIKQANEEKTDWENVIDIFNRRFYVPYTLRMSNKSDSVLRDEAPSVEYVFKDRDENSETVSEEILLSILSQGETRALYLLNIIFEIECRRKQGLQTLLIIDDIADSFDYKNKYAIIEYLKEISDSENFSLVILTHNFDFYRTVQDRINTNKFTQSYMAVRNVDSINLINPGYKYISNPFVNWKKDLNDKVKLIASISFARNIAEYVGDTVNFNKLTSILHKKDDSGMLLIKDIESSYKEIFKDMDHLVLNDQDKYVLDVIFEVAEQLCAESTETALNLENKIVLSIATRINAEVYMISKINDPTFVSKIKSNQTGKLFGRFKRDYSNEVEAIKILEKVNLMTPENIHLNSFMFEPILDLTEHHLKDLYVCVKKLIISEEQSAIFAATAAEEVN
ncbi:MULTISPECIES: hypothetical protein [Paenibacillus]|uniref:hypothetical protein n=1 Tax=Paenibacillus TaxID=44249 RepID=UPI00096F78A0|nr:MULTISPECIES: hypothetical protein [Paenibacillus]OMD20177.1 hypothetical protein BJP48_10660 [Paenibacillus odorifer]OME10510.1 hypothetical protein BSK60_24955 [Paenibacillus odorifer]OMF84510.1 hypothetical protein BK147_33165 [Paenibacillus sp. FSL R7-0337]